MTIPTKDQDLILSLPTVIGLMTGVAYVRQNIARLVTLNYPDGTTESAVVPDYIRQHALSISERLSMPEHMTERNT